MKVRNRLCSQVQVRLLRSRVGARGCGTSGRPRPSQAGRNARGHHAVPTPWVLLGAEARSAAPRLGGPGAVSRPLPSRLPALSVRRPRRPSSLPAAFLLPCAPALSPSRKLGTGYLSGWGLAGGWRSAQGRQPPALPPALHSALPRLLSLLLLPREGHEGQSSEELPWLLPPVELRHPDPLPGGSWPWVGVGPSGPESVLGWAPGPSDWVGAVLFGKALLALGARVEPPNGLQRLERAGSWTPLLIRLTFFPPGDPAGHPGQRA